MTSVTTNTMRAARFERASRQLTVQDLSIPQPGPDEVLVRVEAAGICASDVHIIKGELPPPFGTGDSRPRGGGHD